MCEIKFSFISLFSSTFQFSITRSRRARPTQSSGHHDADLQIQTSLSLNGTPCTPFAFFPISLSALLLHRLYISYRIHLLTLYTVTEIFKMFRTTDPLCLRNILTAPKFSVTKNNDYMQLRIYPMGREYRVPSQTGAPNNINYNELTVTVTVTYHF